MSDYNSAWQFIAALAGDPNTAVIDWRAIHDTNNGIPALTRRGTLPEYWSWLEAVNSQGYGVFAVVNALDGNGRELANVSYIRAHVIDLDNVSAPVNYERATQSHPAPWFAVQTSPNKYHVYWPVQPYQGNDRYQTVQRKLVAAFDSDRAVIDATRVMRVPGLYHMKRPETPHMVTCWGLAGYGQPVTVDALEAALAGVQVLEGGRGERHALGDPDLAAPSLAWVQRALDIVDPNDLDRAEWIAITAAIKQSAWSLTDPDTLFNMWSQWCARYKDNDPAENLKQWNNLRKTELGWKSLTYRIPGLKAMVNLGGVDRSSQLPAPTTTQQPSQPDSTPPMPTPEPPSLDCSGPYLTHLEQQEWFKGCVSIISMASILTPSGRLLNQTAFNMEYGGKYFIVDGEGKKTKSAWEAATTSTLWTIPKADHLRFLPDHEYGAIIKDKLGRRGVNTFIPVEIDAANGDASPFLRHIAAILPDPNDQRVFIEYLAHNVKYPGYKIPWAPLIQSVEGVGKGFIQEALTYIMGDMYCYTPKAEQLLASGSKFNKWMYGKLLIIVNEIKVDEKFELVEVLKPLISDKRVEVEGKGVDQLMMDNPANWVFFTNFKNAVPVSKNGRRWAIFFSALQEVEDLQRMGMNDDYFKAMFGWLEGGGYRYINQWLLDYPIEKGAIPMRAPHTSSTDEALRLSRGPVEICISKAVEDGVEGFRGGWISLFALQRRLKATNAVTRLPSEHVLESVLSKMGYKACGRAPRAFHQEENHKPDLFYFGQVRPVDEYGVMQGYIR